MIKLLYLIIYENKRFFENSTNFSKIEDVFFGKKKNFLTRELSTFSGHGSRLRG